MRKELISPPNLLEKHQMVSFLCYFQVVQFTIWRDFIYLEALSRFFSTVVVVESFHFFSGLSSICRRRDFAASQISSISFAEHERKAKVIITTTTFSWVNFYRLRLWSFKQKEKCEEDDNFFSHWTWGWDFSCVEEKKEKRKYTLLDWGWCRFMFIVCSRFSILLSVHIYCTTKTCDRFCNHYWVLLCLFNFLFSILMKLCNGCCERACDWQKRYQRWNCEGNKEMYLIAYF